MKHRWIVILFVFVLVIALPACQSEPGNDDEEDESEAAPLVGADVLEPLTLCTAPQPPLITDLSVYQTPDLTEPDARTPYRDPVFGTCVVRVTDRQADIPSSDPSRGLKNEYSRVQSFNADGSLLIAFSIDAYWYLYDAASLQPLGQMPLDVEPRWDANDPDIVYFISETRLMRFNVRSGETSLVHDFADDDLPGRSLSMVWTRYEGSPSYDTNTWGLMAEDGDWLTTALLVYDLQSDEVVAVRATPDRPEIDSVTISPLGNYFVAFYDNYCEHGELGTDSRPCGLMVYDRDLQNGRGLLRIVGHSDLAVDAQGREVLIYQDIDTDHIAMLDLESGAITNLFPIDFSGSALGLHFSGRASDLPGWVLISTYTGCHPTDCTWMDDSVFAVELVDGGRVVRLAHSHSLVDENMDHDYWAEPHGSVNQDFTRVVFTSNWGRSGTDEVDMYMVTLPQDWVDTLP